MHKYFAAAIFLFVLPALTWAQNPLPIPAALSGNEINLPLQQGVMAFYPGFKTQTVGYNGPFLGPTIILDQGQQVTLNVHNQLNDTTTVHWHGLHVAPKNDGNQHNVILPGENWSPSFTVMDKAATYWYHPHPHGKTMEQVVKGAAGLIIVHDPEEAALGLPQTYGVDDIPLVFQFKTFDAGKQLVVADEADNAVLVNGVFSPVASLPAQIVRLRLLNGSSGRAFRFGFSDSRSFQQIASDAGLLDTPVSMSRLTLGPGDRAEILVDLMGLQGSTLVLKTYGNELPQGFLGGTMMMGGAIGPLDNTAFNLLSINVIAQTNNPVTSIPATLTQNMPWQEAGAGTRSFNFSAQPMMSMTNFFINGLKYNMDVINFSVVQGQTEIWTITNQTMMAHPFHVHGNPFYVLKVNNATPPANERGRKDVIMVPPMGGTVKLITRFEDFSDPDMPYIYHCHILSHEDTGMMGQFIVNPAPSSSSNNPMLGHVRIFPTLVTQGDALLQIAADPGWEVKKVEVYDLLGRRLMAVEKPSNQISTENMARGVNLVQIKTNHGIQTIKVVKN
ncbi:MAG: multicopper oxidase domain-containing protein [Lewinellaceae bacterium]|nr:multicopper oxidase domain-containing protein [Lewinellaceae bacterium]